MSRSVIVPSKSQAMRRFSTRLRLPSATVAVPRADPHPRLRGRPPRLGPAEPPLPRLGRGQPARSPGRRGARPPRRPGRHPGRGPGARRWSAGPGGPLAGRRRGAGDGPRAPRSGQRPGGAERRGPPAGARQRHGAPGGRLRRRAGAGGGGLDHGHRLARGPAGARGDRRLRPGGMAADYAACRSVDLRGRLAGLSVPVLHGPRGRRPPGSGLAGRGAGARAADGPDGGRARRPARADVRRPGHGGPAAGRVPGPPRADPRDDG